MRAASPWPAVAFSLVSMSIARADVVHPPAAGAGERAGSIGVSRTLSFEERVRAQRVIEGVYWRRRIWPTDNPEPKPALDGVLPDALLRKRVEDYLRKSNALGKLWGRPITSGQLQAEIDRTTKHTRAPEALRELYQALDNDPFLIAETLARQVLADRLIRGWYARDERYHGDLRRRAEAGLAAIRGAADARRSGARYQEQEWRLVTDAASVPPSPTTPNLLTMDETEWRERTDRLAQELGIEAARTGGFTPLAEEDGAFHATRLREKHADRLKLATVLWEKRTFDSWWKAESDRQGTELIPPSETYVLTEPRTVGCTDDKWEPTAGPPVRRAGHTAIWTGSEMIVWGGVDSAYLDTGGRYDPVTDTWTPVTTNGAPAARSHHTAVWTGAKMIVWGGQGGTTGVLDTGGVYNPTTDTWSPVSTLGTPEARFDHTAVWTGNEMIVWGGQGATGLLDSGGHYEVASENWTPTASGAPAARSSHSAVWTGSEMIVWGGQNGAGAGAGTGGRYALGAFDVWSWRSTATTSAPTTRVGHTAVWSGTEMVVWGGRSGGTYFNTGGIYSPSSDSWVATTTTDAPQARAFHTAVVMRPTGHILPDMIVWGGTSSTGTPLNTGASYTMGSNVWFSTPGTDAPQARSGHTAVATDTEMIVWGGGGVGGSPLHTGARYDPSGKLGWLPTSTLDLPDARTMHTATWTGSEMILWGGAGNFGSGTVALATGARYDPATDAWSPTSQGANLPSPREVHVAVWTGSRMIVWGGYNGFSNLNTGGSYDPTTDAWAAVSTTNAPAARREHTAVWSGSEMIVWGGVSSNQATNTGGRYRPQTDSWTATSTTGAPAARLYHRAVWTGSRMIVWGGSDSTGFDTGARYDPLADSWSATSTTGAPTARWHHAAVWSGSEMIVWGGRGTPNLLFDTGGRYDPVSDSWGTISTAGAPAGRQDPRFVWTGTEMIVWGGQGSGSFLDTGSRYDPAGNTWTSISHVRSPDARAWHSAIWTGNEMIVWGGQRSAGGGYLEDGAAYCACASGAPTMWYRDADGDGYGITSVGVPSCVVLSGHSTTGGDCNDANAGVHPGATEVCDGLDNDCDGTSDNVSAPLGSATIAMSRTGGSVTVSWTPLGGATGYDVTVGGLASLLGTGGNYTSAVEGCIGNDLATTSTPDILGPPPSGNAYWYLVRAENCGGTSSYDSGAGRQVGSRDAEIAASQFACP